MGNFINMPVIGVNRHRGLLLELQWPSGASSPAAPVSPWSPQAPHNLAFCTIWAFQSPQHKAFRKGQAKQSYVEILTLVHSFIHSTHKKIPGGNSRLPPNSHTSCHKGGLMSRVLSLIPPHPPCASQPTRCPSRSTGLDLPMV